MLWNGLRYEDVSKAVRFVLMLVPSGFKVLARGRARHRDLSRGARAGRSGGSRVFSKIHEEDIRKEIATGKSRREATLVVIARMAGRRQNETPSIGERGWPRLGKGSETAGADEGERADGPVGESGGRSDAGVDEEVERRESDTSDGKDGAK